MKGLKSKLKVIIPIAIILVVGVIGLNAVQAASSKPMAQLVSTVTLTSDDLQNYISVTGQVESDNAVNVYSTLSYAIDEVLVEVGDVVEEGDLLCSMDTKDLEATIRQNQATLSAAQAKANHNLAVAEKDKETAQYNIDGNYNSQLLQAESTVATAEAAVKRAQNTVATNEHNLRAARQDLDKYLNDYRNSYSDELTITYDDKILSLQQNVTACQIALDGAQQSLEAALVDLEAAKASQRAVEKQVEESQVSTEDQVTTAKLNTDLSDQYVGLQKLQADLADAKVTAPVSGTVTAVYAQEGTSGAGLLFVIEDTDDLKVSTKIKEYDIASVDVGMPVTIKADGTGDDQFDGTVSMIAPTAIKDSTGKVVDTNSPEFEAEVKVGAGSKLRIGMNARMNIIIEQKQGVLSVPTECIVEDDEGVEMVYVVDLQEDGTAVAKAVPVTVGLETDFACEIISPDLSEGDEIIQNPEGIVDGMQVLLASQMMADAALA